MTMINDKGELGTKCKITHWFYKVNNYCLTCQDSLVDNYGGSIMLSSFPTSKTECV